MKIGTSLGDLLLLEAAGVETVTLRFGYATVEKLERFTRDVAAAFG